MYQYERELMHVRELIKAKRFRPAHKKADRLILAQPGDPVPVLMKALVLAHQGRLADGRLVMDRAERLGRAPTALRTEAAALLGDAVASEEHSHDLTVALTGQAAYERPSATDLVVRALGILLGVGMVWFSLLMLSWAPMALAVDPAGSIGPIGLVILLLVGGVSLLVKVNRR